MANDAGTSVLYVEGKDDTYTIANLLERHGVLLGLGKRALEIKEQGSVAKLIANISAASRAATSHPVGFAMDIDVQLADRWSGIRPRLEEVGLVVPEECPEEGFAGTLEGYPYPMGVWLMPDCSMDGGKLEHLLATLIPEGDTIFPYAKRSTSEARRLGAKFGDQDQPKAEIHAWLAWQEAPGRPFGTAIKAEFLGRDSPQAIAFLRWMHRIFQFPQLASL